MAINLRDKCRESFNKGANLIKSSPQYYTLCLLCFVYLFSFEKQGRRTLLSRFPNSLIKLVRGKTDLKHAFVPNSGEKRVFSLQVREIKKVLIERKARTLFFIEEKKVNRRLDEDYQRIIESIYPTKIDQNSNFFIAPVETEIGFKFRVLYQNPKIKLIERIL